MGKLVIILVFSLGALLMLESVQASNDCRSEGKPGYIYVMEMIKPGTRSEWYKIGASINPKSRLKTLQSGNPHRIKLVNTFRVSNCKAAESALKKNLGLSLGKGDGGTEWVQVESHLDILYLATEILKVVSKYMYEENLLSKAMAEGDNDDNTMNDGENSRLHLQELLLRLLD